MGLIGKRVRICGSAHIGLNGRTGLVTAQRTGCELYTVDLDEAWVHQGTTYYVRELAGGQLIELPSTRVGVGDTVSVTGKVTKVKGVLVTIAALDSTGQSPDGLPVTVVDSALTVTKRALPPEPAYKNAVVSTFNEVGRMLMWRRTWGQWNDKENGEVSPWINSGTGIRHSWEEIVEIARKEGKALRHMVPEEISLTEAAD